MVSALRNFVLRELHTSIVLISLMLAALAVLAAIPPIHARGIVLAWLIGMASGIAAKRLYREYEWVRDNPT